MVELMLETRSENWKPEHETKLKKKLVVNTYLTM